jgi:predicted transcriptional regulator
MDIAKVTDGELNVLNVLWKNESTDQGGAMKATEIVKALNHEIGWNRNTTYTFINRLVEKGIIKRTEPGFVCEALYTKEQEAREFINKMFNGSLKTMVASFLNSGYSEKEIAEVKEMLARHKDGGIG